MKKNSFVKRTLALTVMSLMGCVCIYAQSVDYGKATDSAHKAINKLRDAVIVRAPYNFKDDENGLSWDERSNQTVIAQGLSIAKKYGENLRMWTVTENENYRINIEKLCEGNKSTRVADKIAYALAKRNNIPYNISYTLDSYLNWLEKAMEDSLNINVTNYKSEKSTDIEAKMTKDTKKIKDLSFVSCDINVSGTLVCKTKDIICIRNGQITKIAELEKKKDKIVVDLSDIVNDEETIGFTYNYGKHFPIGGSINYSFYDVPIMLSLDFGLNTDDDKVITDKADIKDIMNYTRTKKILDPKFFVTVTPQFYMKYFAIGCGIGALYMEGTEENYNYTSTSSNSSGSHISSGGGMTSGDTNLFKFMLRPVVKGFIPLNDEWYLSLSVGYDYVLGYKDKNGYNAGIGLQYTLDW